MKRLVRGVAGFLWLAALLMPGRMGIARADGAARMGIETLVALLAENRVVVIDTRREGDFGANEGTVAGALRGDPSDVASWARLIDREKIVVVFCS